MSATSAIFRPATPADIEAILPLMRDYYAEDGYRYDEAQARAALAGLLENAERGHLWVAQVAGGIIGYLAVAYGWSLEHGGRDGYIDEIYLAPPWRGRGLGRSGIAFATDACRADGARALHLEIQRDKPRTRELYRRAGFRERDRALMTLWLGPGEDAAG